MFAGDKLAGEVVTIGPMNRQGSFRAQQIKGVCKLCNNGWMKANHERAAPHLVRLAVSDWWELDDAEKIAVSAYFTLVSMMWQLADRSLMAATQDERKALMDNAEPPSNWRVFVAEHRGGMWDEKIMYTGFSSTTAMDTEHPAQPNSHCLVSTFGKVAFSTLSMPHANHHSLLALTDFYVTKLNFQAIWPLGGHAIRRPTRAHSDEELLRVANLFYIG